MEINIINWIHQMAQKPIKRLCKAFKRGLGLSITYGPAVKKPATWFGPFLMGLWTHEKGQTKFSHILSLSHNPSNSIHHSNLLQTCATVVSPVRELISFLAQVWESFWWVIPESSCILLLAHGEFMESHPTQFWSERLASAGVDTGRGEVIATGTPTASSSNSETARGNF